MTYQNLDIRLIRELQDDARQSLRKLARKLDVSPSTVSKRLDGLMERGVIMGFRPVVNYAKLGFSLVAVTRIKARGEALQKVVDSLVEDPRLTQVYEITGEFDVMAIGRFRDEQEMNREIKRVLNLPGIEGTNTSIVLSSPKETLDVEIDEDLDAEALT